MSDPHDAVVELALEAGCDLGEGPLWDADRQRLLFVDITRGHIHEFDPLMGTDRIVDAGQLVGAVALTTQGDWLAAVQDGFVRIDPATALQTRVAFVEADRPETRMNDGYVDARGRFWAGTMSTVGATGQGTLYRLDPDGTVTPMLAPVTTSNGVDWSPDNRLMYYADTRTGRVDVFDFDLEAGTITNRRPFATVPKAIGRPDGLVVDAAGAVWLALWAGGAVHRYLPDGRLDRVIQVPASLTTKPAFGGAALDELYLTTAAGPLTPDERAAQPLAGSVFRARLGVCGRAPHRFG